MSKYARRIDANQNDIVAALRACGAVVRVVTQGDGIPDLLVGYRGYTLLLEVKDGSKPPSRQALTADEALWMSNWAGSYRIVRSEADAEELLRDIERWTECLPEYA